MRMLRGILLVSSILALVGPRQIGAQDVGEVLPGWTPGTLEIHQISTGRGNSSLFIFPDGTTMLVDAGALATKTPRHVGSRPDESRTPGDWIARYIRQMLRHDAAPELNYVLLTHFHGDHMGQVVESTPSAKSGGYKLAGITEVAERTPVRKILDRGWPNYDYPAPLKDATVTNYRAFLAWQQQNNGLKTERFQPGRNDQIVPVRAPKQHANFAVRNIMANGEVWTGTGDTTRQHFPALKDVPVADHPTENMCSAGFRLSYGRFDYYSGGDIPGIPFEGFPLWHDVETPVAQAVGAVDAAILNHHGYIDSQNAFFVATLRPRVWILNVWESAHPTARVYHRLQSTRVYPGPRDIFATAMHEANRQVVVGLDKLASDRGHIVIRVSPGGDSFKIVILDDSAEIFKVKSVHGPYECR
jgi:Metallo-beta-lactamase superfamily